MKVLSIASIAVIASFGLSADAKPTFVSLIPNGDGVSGVAALGHKQSSGGGALNDFGEAFSNAGLKWTVELCKADSDGDGQTNGQELGDPCCEWTKGGQTRYSTGVSHPGDATSKADPSLWASIVCGGASSQNSTAGASPSTASTPAPSSSATAASGAVLAAAATIASTLVLA
ncbi:hypothetical protein P43SY_009496 [Pythium insidiosum]|uniref:Temptin Cys/Cys disulfide domain-containing protein n=1 Tax=Pythium insidiosum TaxID=114742 RepID=A0AAD5M153_PYTIN|nr:hypothetical protein P43SY_009496 [Pythium insidiosum]